MAIDWDRAVDIVSGELQNHITIMDEDTVNVCAGKEILYVHGDGGGGGGGGGEAVWGLITGTLSNQTDLRNALALKLEDAPVDGSYYGRRNGDWELINGESGFNSPEEKDILILHDQKASVSIDSYAETDGKMEKLLSIMAPFQEGSGDPSPSNIRKVLPIESVKLIYSCDKNLLTPIENHLDDEGLTVSFEQGTQRIRIKKGAGELESTDHYQAFSCGFALPKGTYKANASRDRQTINNATASIAIVDEDTQTYYVATTSGDFVEFTLPEYKPHLKMYLSVYDITIPSGTSVGDDVYIISPHLYRVPEPNFLSGYIRGGNWDIAMPSDFYGGTFDFATGELNILYGYIASYNGETLLYDWWSDRDVYVEGTTPTTGAEVVYRLPAPISQQITLPYDPDDLVTHRDNNGTSIDIADLDPTLNYYTVQTENPTITRLTLKIDYLYSYEWLIGKINGPEDGGYYWKRNGKWYALPMDGNSSLSLYVDPVNGDDTDEGTVGNPLATIQKAVYIANASPQQRIDIFLAGGTYTEAVTIAGDKYIQFRLQGNVTISTEYTPITVTSNAFIEFRSESGTKTVTLSGGSQGMDIYGYGRVFFNMTVPLNVSGSTTGILVRRGAALIIEGAAVVTGNPTNGIFADYGGYISIYTANITAITGLKADNGGIIAYSQLSGTMTTETAQSNGGRILTGSGGGGSVDWDDITNKPTFGTMAAEDASDYYDKTDVDDALDTKQNVLTFDTTPTANSARPVTSGGIYTAIHERECHISMASTSSLGTISNAAITTTMRVVNIVWGTPANVMGDVTWNTDTAGQLVLSGTLTGATTAEIDLIDFG